MVVDDSATIRGFISRALRQDPGISVVTSAADGKMAVDILCQHPEIEVVVLDIEMPIMDGMTALPLLLKAAPGVHIIMASTLTLRNAEISLRALALGASDYVPKPSARDLNASEQFYRNLKEKILALGLAGRKARVASAADPSNLQSQAPALPGAAVAAAAPTTPAIMERANALAIASSTGGPQALVELFKKLAGNLSRVPVFVTQHMPPAFTTILAQNISKAAGAECHEATDGEKVLPGVIYVAPGDYHLRAQVGAGGQIILRITQEPPENYCRPAADPMFRSLAAIYGRRLIGVVLTGMGADGKLGAEQIVAAGGQVLAQDEASSVVWGMPRAVAEAGIAKAVLPLDDIPAYIVRAIA
jgi:two-component system chemotaxis response regulator CheB